MSAGAVNPPFNEGLVDDKKLVARGWVTWFLAATGGGKITQPAVGSSPFTYRNTTIGKQQAILTVNALSALQISRDNVNFYSLSTTLGTTVILFPGDYLKITYGGSAPTLTVIPV